MTQTTRQAPNPEWVQMYRAGIAATKIAAVTEAPHSVIRYHLAIAAKQDPGLRAAHKSAAPVPARVTGPGKRNLEDVLTFYATEGRLPVTGRSRRESTLAEWLTRRRKDAAAGALSPAYATALDAIPNWRDHSTKRDADAARWKQRLAEVAAWVAAGNDWPRHQKTGDREERTLGVWLHTQRINQRAGKLTAAKEKQLNKDIPGWRQGRVRRGRNSPSGMD
ncbi:helicase associated domain-containing protein [Arthrobacter sp. ISL-85]|uniref:helicase associated domain-containing protein n=1 Tax=Arthrobacter sp. ISL-85 TaxID=2819115 RepID=UPI001BE503A6|nr:helicase associated domain-containing protein [Arthrobacter sp. ISL-85]MBT2568160.1 helicase associated domain-containing protein [Arthrobacter sp. ISL-85]